MNAPTYVRTVLAVVVLVAALVATLPTAGAPVADAPANETNVSSGEALSSAFAAHGSELEGTVERRGLSASLADAADEQARAALLSERRVGVERRVDRLADRRERLQSARRSGNVSASEFRVRSETIAAEARQLRGLLETVADESRALPDPLRASYGLDDATLNRSRARFDATVDRSFAGTLESTDRDSPPIDAADGDSGAAVRNATAEAVEDARTTHRQLDSRLESVAGGDADRATVDCGRTHLAAAEADLERASAALANGSAVAAEAALVDARRNFRTARRCLAVAEGETDGPGWDVDAGDSGGDARGEESDSGSDVDGVDPSDSTWNGSGFDPDGSAWTDDGGDGDDVYDENRT